MFIVVTSIAECNLHGYYNPWRLHQCSFYSLHSNLKDVGHKVLCFQEKITILTQFKLNK